MDAKRLVEICLFLRICSKVKMEVGLENLVYELGIKREYIESMKFPNFLAKERVWEEKTKKAVFTKLRELIFIFANQKGLVKVGEEIKPVGDWEAGNIFKGLTITNQFIVSKDGESGLRFIDPMKNPRFLYQLER